MKQQGKKQLMQTLSGILSGAARLSAAFFILPGVLLLGACVNLSGAAPRQLISLTPVSVAGPGELPAGSPESGIIILDPKADRSLEGLGVPVQVTDSTIAYLKNARWVERPARQFRSLLAETFRARGKLSVDEAFWAPRGASTRTLSGTLLLMGYDDATHSVVVRYDAQLTSPAGPVRRRRFEARIPDVVPDLKAVAPALNMAANEVAVQVADWAE